jgi:exonuclease VII small subunit
MTETTTTVAATAFEAYREVNDLHPTESLSYQEARAHCHGDTLADFLVLELTEGVDEGENAAAQYERGTELVERAINDLSHVQMRLNEAHYKQQSINQE